MRLTSFSDLSLRVLIFAAANPDRLFTINELTDTYSVSRNHLTKVVNALTRAGFLHALRGRSGGLRLAQEPDTINLAEVIKLTEPDFLLVECMRADNSCILAGNCKLPGPLDEALQAFIGTLGKYTLADLALNPEEFPS